MSFLTLEGITRQWGGQGGVRDINLSLPKGHFLSILGPSGCGKSTLLRVIAGLETPQQGVIRVNGGDVTAKPASERNLSMVFQSYALFPHLDVAENVQFGLKVRRMDRVERARRLRDALEMTGLTGLEARKPAQLSGGQRQRVALARAAVAQKPLCLMDEPLSNLDAKLRNSVRRDIRQLARKLGLTVVYVTHDQSEAMSLSDQVVLMNQGLIEQVGSPQDLYNEPASIFAAQFIGDPPMAVVQGSLVGLDGETSVGIRPEDIQIAPEGQGDLKAPIEDLEFVGDETRISYELPGTEGLVVRLAGAHSHEFGQIHDLILPTEKRLLFNAQSGKLKREPQQSSLAQTRENPAPGNGLSAPKPA